MEPVKFLRMRQTSLNGSNHDRIHQAAAQHQLRALESIKWQAIGKVRSTHHITRRVRTSKMMYGWLPVGHNRQKCNLPSHKCPCCGANEEAFEHPMTCTNESLQAVCTSAVTTIRLNCKKLKLLPLHFTSTFIHVIQMTLDKWESPQIDGLLSGLLRHAVRDQLQLGSNQLILGFMSNTWTDTLDGFGIKQPQSMM